MGTLGMRPSTLPSRRLGMDFPSPVLVGYVSSVEGITPLFGGGEKKYSETQFVCKAIYRG